MPRLTLLQLGSLLSALASLLLFGLGALLLGGASERIAPERGPRVEPRMWALGDLAPGAAVPVNFTVTNTSSRPVKLLGISGFCVSWGCVSAATGFPVRVAPHGSATVGLHLRPSTGGFSGEFATEVILFSDAPGREQTPLRINGRVVRPAEP